MQLTVLYGLEPTVFFSVSSAATLSLSLSLSLAGCVVDITTIQWIEWEVERVLA